MRNKLIVECPRCAHQQTVERAGRFRDADYYELLHEYFALEADLKVARRELLRAQSKLGTALEDIKRAHDFDQTHLWPLALAQLRVMAALLPDEQPA